jgi:hypothetical protein
MSWEGTRLPAYSLLTAALFTLFVCLRTQGGVDQAEPVVLSLFVGSGVCWVVLFAGDVIYHAWRGRGYACPQCGHLRRVRAFWLEPACPHCDKVGQG